MIGYEFIKGILGIIIITFFLGAVPLLGKGFQVVKSIDAIRVEHLVRFDKCGELDVAMFWYSPIFIYYIHLSIVITEINRL